jgi:hypothetical protein
MNLVANRIRPVALGGMALLFCLTRLAGAGDTLVLVGGKTSQGTFLGFKSGRFYFQPQEGEVLRETAVKVQSLALDPAVTVSLKPLGKKVMPGVKLRSFSAPAFVFEADGAELRLPASHVTSVDTAGDFSRAMQHAASSGAARPEAEADAGRLVKAGVVTVVHFHMASSMPSVRAGSYLEAVAARSKGKVKPVTVEISGWDDPLAVRHDIRSAPQFWVYRRNGELSEKLVDDVSPAAIDAALDAAQKPPARAVRPESRRRSE